MPLRVLRTLGKLEILSPLVEDEEIGPNEYFRLVNSAKVKTRRRASKVIRRKEEEAPEW